jgi:hypothetical protein
MSNDLMNILQEQLGNDDLIKNLSQQIGGAEPAQTKTAASSIITTLMGAMTRNASTSEGANSLANALDRDHDGSILDDAMGLLSGQKKTNNNNMLNGAGILTHLLGGKQNGAIDMISKMSGLDNQKTGSLMTMLAPLLMGALGKTKKQSGMGAADIFNLLQGAVSTQKKESTGNQGMDMITMFLDQDGDGDIKDDVMKIGSKLLSGFFRKKR